MHPEVEVPLRYPVNALVSYHYFARVDVAEVAALGLRLIGDSGAFSALTQGAVIDVGAFADWALRWRASLAWVASLDAIGDAEASWRNYRVLRARGLDVVPTVHYGEPPSVLDRYADDGVDFVGLGGMVGMKGEPDRLLRWSLGMFRHARDHHPGMRFHGWGVSHRRLLLNLPWYSVDTSGFGSAYRYARMKLWNPGTHQFQFMLLDGRGPHAARALLADHYGGVTPEMVARSHAGNRRLLIRVSARSLQGFEDHLRSRHQVPAPAYGLADEGTGPHAHFADGGVHNIRDLGPHLHNVQTDLADYSMMGAT